MTIINKYQWQLVTGGQQDHSELASISLSTLVNSVWLSHYIAWSLSWWLQTNESESVKNMANSGSDEEEGSVVYIASRRASKSVKFVVISTSSRCVDSIQAFSVLQKEGLKFLSNNSLKLQSWSLWAGDRGLDLSSTRPMGDGRGEERIEFFWRPCGTCQ